MLEELGVAGLDASPHGRNRSAAATASIEQPMQSF